MLRPLTPTQAALKEQQGEMMRTVAAHELEEWLTQGQLLEQDSHGPKVLCLGDGSILKIFRSRKHPLMARCRPEASRFARNARRLAQRGIRTPKLLEQLWINPAQGVSACRYQPLAGQTLEQLYRQSPEQLVPLIPELAAYILHLHRQGIYFRSLHLGNILYQPGQPFGLIDFLDIRFSWLPLNRWQVKRNFAHLQSYLQRRRVEHFPFSQLLTHYESLRNQ